MGFKIVLSILAGFFSGRCYAAADDKVIPPGRVNLDNVSALVLNSLSATTKFKNILASVDLPFADSICGAQKTVVIFTRNSPYGDTDYAILPIGSMCLELTVAATAVTAAKLWIKNATGANGWAPIFADTAGYVCKYAGYHTTAGGDATEVITITGAISTDVIQVDVCSVGGTPRTVLTYKLSNSLCTVTMSGDPSTDHLLQYQVWRQSRSA